MSWRFIGFLFFLSVLLFFIGINLHNVSNVDFWFDGSLAFHDVPVVFVIAISYLLGAFTTIPVMFFNNRKKEKEKDNEEKGKEKKKKD